MPFTNLTFLIPRPAHAGSSNQTSGERDADMRRQGTADAEHAFKPCQHQSCDLKSYLRLDDTNIPWQDRVTNAMSRYDVATLEPQSRAFGSRVRHQLAQSLSADQRARHMWKTSEDDSLECIKSDIVSLAKNAPDPTATSQAGSAPVTTSAQSRDYVDEYISGQSAYSRKTVQNAAYMQLRRSQTFRPGLLASHLFSECTDRPICAVAAEFGLDSCTSLSKEDVESVQRHYASFATDQDTQELSRLLAVMKFIGP